MKFTSVLNVSGPRVDRASYSYQLWKHLPVNPRWQDSVQVSSSSSSRFHLVLLWGRCCRHNSHPASSVTDFHFCCFVGSQMSRLTHSVNLSFGLHLFILAAATISRVFLPTYFCSRFFMHPHYLGIAFPHLSL